MEHEPSAFEQAMLEYINLARLNPAADFDRVIASETAGTGVQVNITNGLKFFGVDVSAYRTQLAAFDPVAPLAWDASLATAADNHTRLLIEADAQSHQLPGEASLSDRIRDAGYTGLSRVGENVYSYTEDPLQGHAGFMVDWGYDAEDISGGAVLPNFATLGDGMQDPPGHRNTILSSTFTDIGIGAIEETDPTTQVGPWVVTQNFGAIHAANPAQLLGVVIDDRDGDGIYDIGEGLGGVTVTAIGSTGTFTTTSWTSGGYQMELAAGAYTLRFSGPGLNGVAEYNVMMGGANLKRDGFAADARPVTEPTDPDPVHRTGTAAAETLNGAGGNDILSGNGGNDRLNGLAGNDALFGDTIEALFYPDVADQVYRLYQATLGRAPDHTGHLGWIRSIAVENTALTQVASGFTNSTEFQNTYGNLDDSGFVNLLYRNVLGRDADAGGLRGWLDAMATGSSRSDVVLGFSESVEFITATRATAGAFALSNSPSDWSDDVYRLYKATLDRDPDLAGFQAWATNLGTGTPFLTAVTGFTDSTEFRNTYGSLDDSGFVNLLYRNVLDRAADAGGLQGWLNAMATGTSRAEVVQGFSQSAEFIAATAPALATWMRAQGQDDVLTPGAGGDVLAGGMMSDRFVFAPASGTGNRVLDLEAWDVVDLTAFGFSSDAAARSALVQQGADVIFASGGAAVTFESTALSLFTDDLLLV